jgi:hypothetical protein
LEKRREKKMARKEKEVLSPEEQEQASKDAIEAEAPPERPQWELIPWSAQLVSLWREDPAFKKYCKEMGIDAQGIGSMSASGPHIPEGGVDLNNEGSLRSFVLGIMQTSQAMSQPAGAKKANTRLVNFPNPVEVEGCPDPITLYPINFAQMDYSSTGYYDDEVAEILQREIDSARFVPIPKGSAFVTHVMIRKNPDGLVENVREPFVSPGVFAWGTLAESIERQVKLLETIVMPEGEIHGSQTKYDDMVTNGVRLVTGFQYLVPPKVRVDLARRIRHHEKCFQDLGKERKSLMGQQGYKMLGGLTPDQFQLSGVDAAAHKAQGVSAEDAASQIPVGTV